MSVVVISGAGQGQGAAEARLLAARGTTVIATDLTEAPAEDLAGALQKSQGSYEAAKVTYDMQLQKSAQDLKFAKDQSGAPITKNANFGNALAYQDPFNARLGLRLSF